MLGMLLQDRISAGELLLGTAAIGNINPGYR